MSFAATAWANSPTRSRTCTSVICSLLIQSIDGAPAGIVLDWRRRTTIAAGVMRDNRGSSMRMKTGQAIVSFMALAAFAAVALADSVPATYTTFDIPFDKLPG